ncbi:MAG: uracil-DNA glycosylase [Sphingobium sp.]|nr:uracil-DNA glycosylase [Sphingobium sp.]MBP6111445.1 uracil-DNA glycosylase [Sphingobium sp.]MBP8670143.1 uracil-DNA glycosylase [Sphingobium sp.]MBP9157352.1 uracil-DNA glycosylase [Sphingobium sp.]MCC6481941.1 uracil-DNA glycosylase [Sphingomonadaceae bacterium]
MNAALASSCKAQAEGLLAWWSLAGVDCAVCESPVNWLKPKLATTHSAPVHPALSAHGGLPANLDAFHDYLANAPDLPEAGWPGPRILPAGPAAARLMILVHAPDAAASERGAPFDSAGMRLVERMLKTIGLSLSECYIATLSIIAPAGGMIDAEALSTLTERMRHHISLVSPQSLLMLGDQANRALSPVNGLDVIKNLPFVNHSGGIVPTVAIAHPRLMLGQPLAKAGAWRALRELVRDWGQ